MDGEEYVSSQVDLRDAIWISYQRCGLMSDIPLRVDRGEGGLSVKNIKHDLPPDVSNEVFNAWVTKLSEYIMELQGFFLADCIPIALYTV